MIASNPYSAGPLGTMYCNQKLKIESIVGLLKLKERNTYSWIHYLFCYDVHLSWRFKSRLKLSRVSQS